MKRNQIAHFSEAPNVSIERSVFDLSFGRHTSFDAGKLYPIMAMEVLPGDTIHLDSSMVTRMQTPVFPVMDNITQDTFFFFCPNRLLWQNWKAFMGENNVSAWDDPVEYTAPMVNCSANPFVSGSLADHFGLPLGVQNVRASAFPYRAYRLIWNEWFRNQNLQAPKLVNLGNSTGATQEAAEAATAREQPFPVNRFRDYFSSSLPAPQKGAAVSIPLAGTAPVMTGDLNLAWADQNDPGLAWYTKDDAAPSYGDSNIMAGGWITAGSLLGNLSELQVSTVGSLNYTGSGETYSVEPKPLNLQAYLDRGTGFATVNALRQAFQIQRILEKDARSGSRYVELLRSHFGVIAPDASLQRPEYLGGRRVTLNIDQVLQTSSTDDTSPLGQTGAYSKTVDSGAIFRKSFTEHGWLIGLTCIRTDRSYQQGIPREFSRESRFDYYFPALAHLGEQQVKTKELYFDGDNSDRVFGYQEAWAEYRSRPNQITGAFRTNYVGGEGYNRWHYADWYNAIPTLSDLWSQEGKERVARTLTVTDGPIDSQFIADIWYTIKAARPMPLYSIPGLIDHF